MTLELCLLWNRSHTCGLCDRCMDIVMQSVSICGVEWSIATCALSLLLCNFVFYLCETGLDERSSLLSAKTRY
jgi:hypothetical protein